MSGSLPTFKHGPVTVEVSGPVKGGTLVEADPANVGKVKTAGAGSLLVLGVSYTDARPEQAANYTTSDGFPGLDISGLPKHATVDADCYMKVKYAAAANYGDTLIAAADGTVTPAGATPDARTIVGKCYEPLGVAAGAFGLTHIDV